MRILWSKPLKSTPEALHGASDFSRFRASPRDDLYGAGELCVFLHDLHVYRTIVDIHEQQSVLRLQLSLIQTAGDLVQVTLLREHAQGPNQMMWVLPTGGFDPVKHGGSKEAGARAELSEEAHLTGGDFQQLTPPNHPGIVEGKWCANRFTPFLCLNPQVGGLILSHPPSPHTPGVGPPSSKMAWMIRKLLQQTGSWASQCLLTPDFCTWELFLPDNAERKWQRNGPFLWSQTFDL